MSLAGARGAARATPGAVWWAVWGLFLLATAALWSADPALDRLPPWLRVAVSPLMLFVQWSALVALRPRWQALLRRVPLAPPAKFLVLGLFLAIVLGNNFAVSFDLGTPDLDPDPLRNTLLYVGPYGGRLCAYYALRHVYVFGHEYVFWTSAFLGAIGEQGRLIPRALLAGDPLTALIALAAVVPAYGVPFASAFVVLPPEELPDPGRRPGLRDHLVVLACLVASFHLGALAWYALLDAALGTRVLAP